MMTVKQIENERKARQAKYVADNPFRVIQEIEQKKYGFRSAIIEVGDGDAFVVIKRFRNGRIANKTFTDLYSAEMHSTYCNK